MEEVFWVTIDIYFVRTRQDISMIKILLKRGR